MSGLIGVVQRSGKPISDRMLTRMSRKLVHSGPIPNTFRDGAAAFAWRGTEHTAYTSDELFVLLEGWIAFRDAPTDIIDDRARTAATVAEAWRRWGIDLVRYVEGEFLLAVYERRSGVLHVLGDATGTRPVFWARDRDNMAFASDVTPLLELPWVSRTLARDHLAEYLAFRVVHAPRTLLRDVHRLPPGHRMRAGDEAVRVTRYHQPTYAAPGTAVPREADVVPELTAAIERAVRRRLSDTREVGVYLSGGVGSTAIVAAARAASARLKTFTVSFAEEPYPEHSFAGRVASLMGMDHRVVTVGSKDVAEQFDAAVAVLGMPIGNVAVVLQMLLAKATAEDVDVVLTGDGTDQLFGGAMLEGPAAKLRRAQRFHALPSPMRGPIARALTAIDRGHSIRVSPADLPLLDGVGGVHLFHTRRRRSLLLDESLVRPSVRTEVLHPFYDEIDTDVLNTILHAFYMSSLVADTLPRVEATAAAANLAVGFPLLDQDVQRLAQVLPGAFKVGGLGRADLPTRWLLRAALQGVVPTALVNRPDRGLPRPLDDWLTGAGRLFMEDRFAKLREDPLELFHTTSLEALKRGLGRTPGATQRMWALFVFDAWARRIGAI